MLIDKENVVEMIQKLADVEKATLNRKKSNLSILSDSLKKIKQFASQ
ncbi:hypothetical protein [Bacillus toyonensis]|nr:hypothetical protein [Bacillus toyonensis]MBU4642805.1 hypothetical protein [Bacillus toyonensis]